MIQAVKKGASLTDQELQAEVDTIMLAVSWSSRHCVSRTSWDNIHLENRKAEVFVMNNNKW
jgi:ribonuclease I